MIYISENIFNEIHNNSLLLEFNQYKKLITLEKTAINEIRSRNSKLNKILSNPIFKEKKVYIKGGVARLAFEIFLKKDQVYDQIRDIDYCYIGDYDKFRKLQDKYDVEIYFEGSNLREYFDNRDISFNQILLRPDMLIFTRRAYRDYEKKIINPLAQKLDDRAMARTLLFAARYNYQIPDSIIFRGDLNPFEFLVCLLKAYELNIQKKYFYICQKYNLTENAKSHVDWLLIMLLNEESFNLYGREELILNDIKYYNDQERLAYIYKRFPLLKKKVSLINDDEPEFYLHLLRKRNKYKKSIKSTK